MCGINQHFKLAYQSSNTELWQRKAWATLNSLLHTWSISPQCLGHVKKSHFKQHPWNGDTTPRAIKAWGNQSMARVAAIRVECWTLHNEEISFYQHRSCLQTPTSARLLLAPSGCSCTPGSRRGWSPCVQSHLPAPKNLPGLSLPQNTSAWKTRKPSPLYLWRI